MRIILLTCIAVLGYSQDTPKTFGPPPRTWKLEASLLVNPQLVQADCVPDYVKSFNGGVEGRQLYLQLRTLHCVEVIDGVPLAFSLEKKTFTVGENKKLELRHVVMTAANVAYGSKDLEAYLDALESLARHAMSAGGTTELMKEGWVTDTGFLPTTRAELCTLLQPKAGKSTLTPAPAPSSNPSAGKINNR